MNPTNSTGAGGRKKIAGLAIIIFIATFLTYYNTLRGDFIWDDEFLILKNSQIKSISHFWSIFKTYIGFGSENINYFYRPLQELSNMADYYLWGQHPFGFHLTNVLLHSCAAVIVFIFVLTLSGNIAVSALTGILFGIHPINTEAVSYIAGRADPLYAVFFLSALIFFIRYTRKVVKGEGGYFQLVASCLFFILALLSKEVSLILPLVLILYIAVILKGTVPRSLYKKLRIAVLPAVIIVVFYALLRFTVLNFFKIAPQTEIIRIPFILRIITFCKTIPLYLSLLAVPVGLHMERVVPVAATILNAGTFASLLIVLSILACGIWLVKRDRMLSFFVFWFFVNLLSVSNIIPINSFMAEHWLYLPVIGLFFIASYFVYTLYKRFAANPAVKLLLIIIVGSAATTYSWMTVERNKTWRDEIAFFKDTLRYQPDNPKVQLALGNAYYEEGDYDKALEQFRIVMALKSDSHMAYSNSAAAYLAKGDIEQAERYIKKAIEVKFEFPFAHHFLGSIYCKTGRLAEGGREFEIAVQQLPQQYQSWNMLGMVYTKLGERDMAINAFRKSISIMPNQENVKASLERLNN